MNQRAKYLFKNVGILTISNFASKILIFLLVPLYTSVLSTSEYGIYDIVLSTIQLLYPILTINISDALMRFCMDKSVEKRDVATIGLKYVLGSYTIATVLMIVARLLGLFKEIEGMEVIILIYFMSFVANQYLVQFAKGIEKVKHMGIAGIIGTVAMIVLNILLLIVFPMGLLGFFVANTLAQLIQAVYLFISTKYWRYVKFDKCDKTLQKEMCTYCVPLIFTTIGWWVNSSADRYVVAGICGVAANGLLSVAYKIPQIMNTFQTIFIQAWQISAIKEYGEEDTASFYGEYFSTMNVFMSMACAALIFLSRPIAYILYAREFYNAWQYVPFLLVATVLNSASGFLGPILSAKKDSKSMAMSAIYGSVVNIVLNIALVLLIGVQGATIATVISSYVIYIVRKRAVKNEIKIENYTGVVLTWMLLCVQAAVEIYTQSWIIEFAIILILIVINRKVIKSILDKVLSIVLKKHN